MFFFLNKKKTDIWNCVHIIVASAILFLSKSLWPLTLDRPNLSKSTMKAPDDSHRPWSECSAPSTGMDQWGRPQIEKWKSGTQWKALGLWRATSEVWVFWDHCSHLLNSISCVPAGALSSQHPNLLGPRNPSYPLAWPHRTALCFPPQQPHLSPHRKQARKGR